MAEGLGKAQPGDGALLGEETEEDLEVQQEREHVRRVVNAFLYYRNYCLQRLEQSYGDYLQLPAQHQKMLTTFPKHIGDVRKAIDTNFDFVKLIVSSAVGMFENSDVSQFDLEAISANVVPATAFDMEKVKTTVKQFFRDWSVEGAKEREMCYKPIIDEITQLLPLSDSCVGEVSVLVPGAGLGRLAYELAKLGYTCQGNEFSMFMLLASNFILNQADCVNSFTICPWATQYCNNWTFEDQVREVRVPDSNPSDLPRHGRFSMAAGDFLQVYTQEGEWDCVACCFFIDTAHNVIEYLEKIHTVLKPGGYWINFGPLLYHYAGTHGEMSLELSWEEIRRIAEDEIGFEILKDQKNHPSHYIQNPSSMVQMTYNCAFMVARKKSRTEHAVGEDPWPAL